MRFFRRFYAVLTVFIAWANISSPSQAAWEYQVQTDEFDGSRSELSVTYASGGREALVLHANGSGTIDPEGHVRLSWHPDTAFICSTSERETVEWIVLDREGETVQREALSRWDVSSNRRVLRAGTRPTIYPFSDAQALLAWMFNKKASELRLRLTDDCGDVYFSVFSLDGFRETVREIVARQQ